MQSQLSPSQVLLILHPSHINPLIRFYCPIASYLNLYSVPARSFPRFSSSCASRGTPQTFVPGKMIPPGGSLALNRPRSRQAWAHSWSCSTIRFKHSHSSVCVQIGPLWQSGKQTSPAFSVYPRCLHWACVVKQERVCVCVICAPGTNQFCCYEQIHPCVSNRKHSGLSKVHVGL